MRGYAIPIAGLLLAGSALGLKQLFAPSDSLKTSTGRAILSLGDSIGSFPTNILASPDGKWLAISTAGADCQLAIISAETGEMVSSRKFPGSGGLYYGLSFDSKNRLFASQGWADRIFSAGLSSTGQLLDQPGIQLPKQKFPANPAGVSLVESTGELLVANNESNRDTGFKGSVSFVSVSDQKVVATVPTGGFPYAVVNDGERAFVSSEQDDSLTVVNLKDHSVAATVRVGAQPTGLALCKDRLYVANSNSDTVSVVDTHTLKTLGTVLLRPAEVRGLAGITPLGLTLSADGSKLYVACADLNAVAQVDTSALKVDAYYPVGWYPTAVALSKDQGKLFVVNGKGSKSRNPNGIKGSRKETYILNVMEGTVQAVDLAAAEARKGELSEMALHLAGLGRKAEETERMSFRNPGIKHVIYIIKENRTFDDLFGDLANCEADPAFNEYPRSVTPNQHALAERFGVLDNFYTCAEVSADGWNWSTSGMANEYNVRNTIYNYTGHGRNYDFEGEVNNSPVSILGKKDVGEAPGGYFWDLCARNNVSYRNYGFFLAFGDSEEKGSDGKPVLSKNEPVKVALKGHTDPDFLLYSNSYPDSEAYLKHGLAPAPRLIKSFGAYKAPSRFTEWKREFDGFVKGGNLPQMSFVRFNRDHTAGSARGLETPRAMVADNDYAVGQLVEAVSKSPYWKDTMICVLEDDSQGAEDHIDAHRSPALVISAYNRKGLVDHKFYNTDSMLRTMELALGLPPMCQFDALAPPINPFDRTASNSDAYEAILPAKEIVGELNADRAAFQTESEVYAHATSEENEDGRRLAKILWRINKGKAVR